MKKQLTHITPIRAGIVFGIIYGIFGLVCMPFFLLAAAFGSNAFGGVIFAILFPVIFAVGSFINGVIMALIYNLVAKKTGGFEVEVRDAEASEADNFLRKLF